MTLNKMIKWLEDKVKINKQLGIRKSTIEFTAKDIRDLLYQLNELKQVKGELDVYKKALELMADELASNKHCTRHPYCYIEEDEEDCQLIEECHNKEWLMDYYLEEARKNDSD